MNKFDKLRGMPAGFPFAMILLGVVFSVAAGLLNSIREWFFASLSQGLSTVAVPLIEWGAILQGVLWICGAFAKKTNPPAP